MAALGSAPAAWLADCIDSGAPAALGGCRCGKESFGCCEYNVTVFDGGHGVEEASHDGQTVIIRHDSVTDPSSGTFAHLAGMRVIADPEWEIGPRLSAMAARREWAFRHAMKSALVDAGMMATRARASLGRHPATAPFWLKCAAYSLADSISYGNMVEPGPAHMMARFRAMPKSATNEGLSAVGECLGLERATPSLLDRMAKSAAGFAGMAGLGELAVAAMLAKARHLESESLLADCHYYIGYATCSALRSRREYARALPDAELYALKVALDPEGNAQRVERQIGMVESAAAALMARARADAAEDPNPAHA